MPLDGKLAARGPARDAQAGAANGRGANCKSIRYYVARLWRRAGRDQHVKWSALVDAATGAATAAAAVGAEPQQSDGPARGAQGGAAKRR